MGGYSRQLGKTRSLIASVKTKKTGILWTYIEEESGLPGEENNARFNIRLLNLRQTEEDTDG